MNSRTSIVAVALALLAGVSFGATCTYNGAWDALPAEGDDIVVTSGDMIWSNSFPKAIASWTQNEGYTGTVTFDTGLEPFEVTGNVTLNGGTWTHTANPSFTSSQEGWTSGRGTKQLIVKVGGDLLVAESAKIDVTGMGFKIAQGPGNWKVNGGDNSAGASHGGSGCGIDSKLVAPPCYGSAHGPNTIGSGGHGTNHGTTGGGAVRLTVGGALCCNGLIAADGASKKSKGEANEHYAGSGGSVWITAGTIAGNGTVRADGGASTASCSGGGGRVAIHLTRAGATMADASWTVTAYPGTVKSDAKLSFPGSVYVETAADDGKGVVSFTGREGRGVKYVGFTSNTYRNYGSGLTADESFREIRLSGRTFVRIPSNVTVTVDEIYSQNDAGDGQFNFINANVWTNKVVLAGGTLQVPSDFVLSNLAVTVEATGSTLKIGDTEGNGNLVIRDGGEFQVNAPTVWAGNIHVENGGIISHAFGTTRQKALDLTVDGDLTIDAGGAVDVVGRGYTQDSGPGKSTINQSGASHGGRGSAGNTSYGPGNGKCYGSIVSPTHCGSGGRWTAAAYRTAGGGSAKVTVTGTFLNNGAFAADGGLDDYHTGSGGSAWVIAKKLTGSGSISANGGTARNGGGAGGGGRVAVWLTDAASSFDDFTGAITAYGGKKVGGKPTGAPGTVYLKTAAQDVNGGTLIIDNGPASQLNLGTRIDDEVTDTVVGSVKIAANAHLEVMADQSLSFSGDWQNLGKLVCETGTTVERRSGAGTSVISGQNPFCNFTAVGPGETLKFTPTDSLFSIAEGGTLTLAGEKGNPLSLVSETEETSWQMAIDAATIVKAEYLSVIDSDASSGALVVANNGTGVRCANWSFVNVIEGETITWTGEAGNGLWSDGGNWDLKRPPTATDCVAITNGCATYPKLVESYRGQSLTVDAGASLDLDGWDLAVGALTNAGTLVARAIERISVSGDVVLSGAFTPARSTFVLSANADAVLSSGGNRFCELDLDLGGGVLSVTDGIDAQRLSIKAAAASTVLFAGGSTVKAAQVAFDGLRNEAALLTLGSAAPGTAWKLTATDSARAAGVCVTDSDASGGLKFRTNAPSSGDASDVNWEFATAEVRWTGAAGTRFADGGNWSGGEAPGEDDIAVIDAAATVVVDGEASVGELRLGGGEGAVSFKVSAPLSVGGSLEISSNATVTMDVPTTVGNALVIGDGGILTHTKNASTDPNRITLAVGGNAWIARGGRIDVKGCGYGKGKGPGGVGCKWAGGSHGGRGAGTVTAPCYGSVFWPTNSGSSGSSHANYGAAGGGAVRLTVGGALEVEGRIDAEGGDDIVPQATSGEVCFYSGAGGSIWLTAASLKGFGKVTANGGWDKHDNESGGGGRIAVYLTASDAPAETLSITCYGGGNKKDIGESHPSAAPGTIYLQGQHDADGEGTIVVDNGYESAWCRGNPVNNGVDLPAPNLSEPAKAFREVKLVIGPGAPVNVTADNLEVGDVDIRKGGVLAVDDVTLWIRSLDHRRGKGWAGEVRRLDGNGDGVTGDVRWMGGFMILVR